MSKQHATKWAVVWQSGAVRYFTSREDAIAECVAYGGFKILAPIYGDE